MSHLVLYYVRMGAAWKLQQAVCWCHIAANHWQSEGSR